MLRKTVAHSISRPYTYADDPHCRTDRSALASTTLLRRLPDLQLASATPTWETTYGMRTLATLPVSFTPQPEHA